VALLATTCNRDSLRPFGSTFVAGTSADCWTLVGDEEENQTGMNQ
jgi:hypothetical protein